MRCSTIVGVLILFAGCSAAVSQEPARRPGGRADWPQFRGPGGLGVSGDRSLPATWGDGENVLWKTPLPGAGTSSPVVRGERIYLTCHTGYGLDREDPGEMDRLRRHVLCLDRRDGRILWQKEADGKLPESEYQSRMLWHGYASSTPAIDAERVYAFFGRSGVFAFDHDGNQLWRASVGEGIHPWGSAASPVLFGEVVILNAFVESGSLVALDRKTGREVWRAGGLKESWNTPVLVEVPGGKTELVVGDMGHVYGYDPASGERLWTCEGINWYIVGSLAVHDGVVYCIAGSDYETVAVKAGGRGDVTGTHLLWRADEGSNVSSPVYHEGHVYFAHENLGIAYCLDAETGKVVYQQRLPRVDAIYASPVVADGKLYYVTRQRGTVVLPAAPEYRVLAHNRFESDDSVFNASPAVTGGRLLLRSDRNLYCIGAE
jgi:outer membrane protein assembly factor BamB